MSSERIKADPKKVEAVQSWLRPSSATNIRSFLGLAGYYRQFVEGFSSIASPMTRLVQKGASFRQKDINLCQRRWLELLKDYDIIILYHQGKANAVADALSHRAESLGSLTYLPTVERPTSLNVQALANQFVRLDIFEPSQLLACVVSWSSLYDRIRERQYDDPHLLVLKDTVQHGDAKEVTIGGDGALRMHDRLCVANVDGLCELIL
ncbi:uncharacterized protein [Nicotiana sylvestris]|uniref:uncharacterized protein n=1 Tax=Nicotiana sylvestris TaxID=4096 RepID=UPI00388CD235